jgi:hypothetical protein
MDLLKMIFSQVDEKNALGTLGSAVGAEPSQVESLMKIGLPVIMQKMGQNASSSEGRGALERVLEQHQDDDVTDFDNFLQRVDVNEGDKILSHVFPSGSNGISDSLAKKTGMDSNQVTGILKRMAQFILGSLGQQKKQNVDVGNIAGLLGSAIDQGKNDGSMLDDAGKLLGGLCDMLPPLIEVGASRSSSLTATA